MYRMAPMRLGPSLVLFLLGLPRLALGADLSVGTAQEIRAAFGSATAGDRIVIAPGEYSFNSAIWSGNAGPVVVTTTEVGAAKLNFNSTEGLVMDQPDWTLERIWVNGVCAGEACEAGIGVKPSARRFTLRNARVSNWTQHVKGARDPNNEVEDGLIASSEFWNDALRPNGATPIDLVGGKRWRIVGNYVHDYGGDPNGDYGIFLKGGTSDGLIEGNLVACAQDNPAGGATVGISFGGGGTGYSFCANQNCDCEDYDGIARNNIVLHCTDAGLHTKRACGSKFYNNTVYDVGAGVQIQINGAGAPVDIRNNVLSGGISGPGTLYTESNNLLRAPAATFRSAYANPDVADFRTGSNPSSLQDQGANLGEVTTDYCGAPRSMHDLGAIEFPSQCDTWPWAGGAAPVDPRPDAGVPDTGPRDTGGAGPDAGSPADAESSDPDLGFAADAGVPAPRSDAGATDAGTEPVDDGPPGDLRGGCRAAPGASPELVGLCLAGLLLSAARARRRRSAPGLARARDSGAPSCRAGA